MIPVSRLYLFDSGGLVSIVEFKDTEYEVKVDWPPRVSFFGSRLVATAMKYKLEQKSDLFKWKNILVYIGDKYILAIQYKKENDKKLARLLKKIHEILIAVKSFDPKELGEVAAKAVITEYTV